MERGRELSRNRSITGAVGNSLVGKRHENRQIFQAVGMQSPGWKQRGSAVAWPYSPYPVDQDKQAAPVSRTARLHTVPILTSVPQEQEKCVVTRQTNVFLIDRQGALGYTLAGFRRLKRNERSTTSDTRVRAFSEQASWRMDRATTIFILKEVHEWQNQ